MCYSPLLLKFKTKNELGLLTPDKCFINLKGDIRVRGSTLRIGVPSDGMMWLEVVEGVKGWQLCTDLFVMITCCFRPSHRSKFIAKIIVCALNYWARARFSLLKSSLWGWSAICAMLPRRTFIAASHRFWQRLSEELGLLPAHMCWLHTMFLYLQYL